MYLRNFSIEYTSHSGVSYVLYV